MTGSRRRELRRASFPAESALSAIQLNAERGKKVATDQKAETVRRDHAERDTSWPIRNDDGDGDAGLRVQSTSVSETVFLELRLFQNLPAQPQGH